MQKTIDETVKNESETWKYRSPKSNKATTVARRNNHPPVTIRLRFVGLLIDDCFSVGSERGCHVNG